MAAAKVWLFNWRWVQLLTLMGNQECSASNSVNVGLLEIKSVEAVGHVITKCEFPPPQSVCSTLWCTVGTTCHSKLDGAVDGTSCGEDKVSLISRRDERRQLSWLGIKEREILVPKGTKDAFVWRHDAAYYASQVRVSGVGKKKREAFFFKYDWLMLLRPSSLRWQKKNCRNLFPLKIIFQ